MKKCGCCKEYFEDYMFSKRGNCLQSFCKSCQNKISKDYRKYNKKSCNKNLKDWRKTHSSKRNLTEKQKLEERFRARMRAFLKSSSVHKIFGYSSSEIFELAQQTLKTREFKIKYKTPLHFFDLSKIEEQKKAASINNLILEPK